MDTLAKSALTTLANFLQQHQQDILSRWLERVTLPDRDMAPAGQQTYWQYLRDFYYPGIIKSIINPQDVQVIRDFKKAVKKGQLVGVPYKQLVKAHFVFRDIILEEIESQKESLGWGQAKTDWFTKIIQRVIDNQVAKIGEFHIQLLFEELTDSQMKQQSLSCRIPEIIYSYSPEDGFTFVSHAVERLLGIKPDEFYHQKLQLWLDYVHPQDQKKVLKKFKQQIRDKTEAEFEYRMLHRNRKDLLHVINRSAAMLDETGNLTSIDGIIIDITQIKKMEHQLRLRNDQLEIMTNELRKANQRLMQIDQRKSELVNIVAHDLRNPLNSIRMFIELLLTYKNSPLENEEFLHKIDQESLRLINLIDNFLDIEKIEAGRIHYKSQPVDLTELIQHFVSIYLWETKKKGITLNAENLDGIPTVIGDRHRLGQVFSNLLANAIRFTPKGGSINIRARAVTGTRLADRMQSPAEDRPPKYVKISVQDTGPGIDPKFHKKIFDKFYQVHSPALKKDTGIGLGLAISKEVVEHQGGRIWVESEKGKGATFFFTLPIEGG
jgi:PAS domain S-box-containing protein